MKSGGSLLRFQEHMNSLERQ